jgi:starch synthase (maltosyl-transferring)
MLRLPREIRHGQRPYEQIVIEDVRPAVEGGHHAVKALVGDVCRLEATIFRHGHDRLRAVARVRTPADETREVPMAIVNAGLDRWQAVLRLDRVGRYRFTVAAWTDHYASWVEELRKRVAAAQPDIDSEVAEGLSIVERARRALKGDAEREVAGLLDHLREARADASRLLELASAAAAMEVMGRYGTREDEAEVEPAREIMSDRSRAGFGAWYELFVRSQSSEPGRPGTFADAERRLEDIHRMGFDVVYLAPIHPVGYTNRKGPNNRVGAAPGDPGSPWAIGSAHGGHTAVEPALGTLADFDRFVAAAGRLGMEVALDFAIQCSPDHPWVTEHPDWFYRRPDGSIRYAENPPKKYQDIYPLNFDTPDWERLWEALGEVVRFWIARGVRIFRVDNPHTKPIGFWTWLIGEIQRESPDVLFLAEAFTRPPMMAALGRRGFTQSYTYFTWRNTKRELTEYLTELTTEPMVTSFRPNLFVNTPDILPPILQQGGRPAFQSRLVLAATLSPSYGIYSGFELCENAAIPGREEYLDSEKYEIKVRDWNAPGNLNAFIARLNAARRGNAALQRLDNLRFLEIADDNLIAYVKTTPDRSNTVIVIVNLDPYSAHEATMRVSEQDIGVPPAAGYEVVDVLTDRTFLWREVNYVRLDPIAGVPAHVLVVRTR